MSPAHANWSISMTTSKILGRTWTVHALNMKEILHFAHVPYTTQPFRPYLRVLTVLHTFHTEQTKLTHEYKQHLIIWFRGGSVRVLDTENFRAISPPLPLPLHSQWLLYLCSKHEREFCLFGTPLSITFASHLSNLTWYIFVWGNRKGNHWTMEVIVMTMRYSPGGGSTL